jgi:Zn-dependent peptidase ImmA (M78 family)/DNA-binding Xre family transcriptional regulator
METLDYHRLGTSIQALRKARNISQTELAKALGLNSPRAISELESGKRELRGSEIRALCEKLECTLAELFGLEADPLASTSGACLRGSDAKDEELVRIVRRALRHAKLLREIEEVLGRTPNTQLPVLDKSYPLSTTRESAREQAIELAGWMRNFIGAKDGPIENLEKGLESCGVVWATWNLPEGVSGLTLRCNGRPVVILESREHEQRQLFTMSHELAHALLDTSEHAVLTRDYRESSKGRKNSTGIVEQRANHFAGAFLMPESAIREFAEGRFRLDEPVKSEDISKLARHFHVSFQAVATRLAHLGFITWDRYKEIKDSQLEMRNLQQIPEQLSEVIMVWASKLQSSPRMLELIIEALEKDLITFGRACELAMTDRETLELFLTEYSRAENGG